MLICENFVVLNMPKTGSTFVRTVVKEIYRQRAERTPGAFQPEELILPNLNVPDRPLDQHGTYRQIPEYARSRVVVSVARNLYEKLRSTYEFGFWQEYPSLPREELLERFPHFPDLSIDEYVEMNVLAGRRKVPNGNRLHIGNQTIQFIRMYFRDPVSVIDRLTSQYMDGDEYEADMPEITFLRHEDLNSDLAQFLQRMGFSEQEIEFCRAHPKVNEAQRRKSVVEGIPPESVCQYVQEYERLLIRILSDRGLSCDLHRW